MGIKAAFLDFNGVILDDRDLSYKASCEMLRSSNVEHIPTLKEWQECVGSNFLENFFRKFGLPSEKSNQDVVVSRIKFVLERWNEARLRPQLKEVLAYLKNKGIKTMILSAEASHLVDKRIQEAGLSLFFDKICAETWPKKKYMAEALDFLKFKPDEVLLVDDSPEEIVSGNELGICTVAFMNPTAHGLHDRLREARPRFTISELPELVKILNIIEVAEYLNSVDSGLILPKKEDR